MLKINLSGAEEADKASRLMRIGLFHRHLDRHKASSRRYLRCHSVFEGLRRASPEIDREITKIIGSLTRTGKLPPICDAEVLEALFEMGALEINMR